MLVSHFKKFLEEKDYLDPIPVCLKAKLLYKNSHDALTNALCQALDRGSIFLFVLLCLSAGFDKINHCILDQLAKHGFRDTAPLPSYLASSSG